MCSSFFGEAFIICKMHFASIETLNHTRTSIGNAVMVVTTPMNSGRTCRKNSRDTMYMMAQSQKSFRHFQKILKKSIAVNMSAISTNVLHTR